MAAFCFLGAVFGLLSCGMPIFLVLGILTAALYIVSASR